MADDEHLLEVGRIHKPHGVRGDLLVSLVTDVEGVDGVAAAEDAIQNANSLNTGSISPAQRP